MAVSVCITPAAPSPLPMPYPLTGSVAEGIADSPLRTKYTWDARDQLRSATLPDGTRVALDYDAVGRRSRKVVSPKGAGALRIVEYVWDGDVLAMQVDSVMACGIGSAPNASRGSW